MPKQIDGICCFFIFSCIFRLKHGNHTLPNRLRNHRAFFMIGRIKHLRAMITALLKIILVDADENTIRFLLNLCEPAMDIADFSFPYGGQGIVADGAILFPSHLDTVSGSFQQFPQLQGDRKIHIFFQKAVFRLCASILSSMPWIQIDDRRGIFRQRKSHPAKCFTGQIRKQQKNQTAQHQNSNGSRISTLQESSPRPIYTRDETGFMRKPAQLPHQFADPPIPVHFYNGNKAFQNLIRL